MCMKVVDWMGSKHCVSRVLEPSEAFPLVIETESSTTAIATQEQVRNKYLKLEMNIKIKLLIVACMNQFYRK